MALYKPYHPRRPPVYEPTQAVVAVALPYQHTHAIRTQAPCRQKYQPASLTAVHILISRVTRVLPAPCHLLSWVVSDQHFPLELLRISRFDPLTAGPRLKRQGFSRPLR